MLHSIPLVAPAAPCFTLGRAARGVFTVGYAAFGSGDGRPLPHRLLPLNFPVLILDFESGAALLTGPRARASLDGPTSWARGVSIGLTPLGAAALAAMPVSEISGQALAVDLPWAATLAALPSWPARFAWLDAAFSRAPAESCRAEGRRAEPCRVEACRAGDCRAEGCRAEPCRAEPCRAEPCRAEGCRVEPRRAEGCRGRALPSRDHRATGWAGDAGPGLGARGGTARDPSPALPADARWRPSAAVTAAWWRLQRGPTVRVSDVAAGLGFTRRRLERDFRREIGLSPGAVTRTARLQRSISGLLRGDPPSAAAAAGGFADQPHLTRTMHSAVGLTPGAFRAFVQDVAPRTSLASGA